MRVTAIMLARDHVDLTLRAIQALIRELGAAGGGELVLVDQASKDGTPERVEAAVGDAVPLRILEFTEPIPYAPAVNVAASRATGDLVLLLDNDTELLPGALATLIHTLRDDDRVAAIGPKLLFPDGQIQDAGQSLPLWLVPMTTGTNSRGDDHRFNFPRSAFGLATSCLLVRRPALEAVEGLDEGLAWGFEGADLGQGIRKRGWRMLFEPRAACVHLGGATLSEFPGLVQTDANRKRFLDRWGVDLLRRVAAYLDRLAEDGPRRFLIYGTGDAARHLANTLELGGYEVTGFLSTNGVTAVGSYPAWNLRELPELEPSRVLIGSPDVREAEDALAGAGLLGGAALPILIE